MRIIQVASSATNLKNLLQVEPAFEECNQVENTVNY
jgi:hypothetical protein